MAAGKLTQSAATKLNQRSLTLPSFAKINWNLKILAKRPDGYHTVSTTLQTISLRDDLYFEINDSGAISLTCDEPDVPSNEKNLVVRAARELKDRYRVDSGVCIRLEKRIPTQSGLGGGSSNAAVTLMALAQLWQVGADFAELHEIASRLGADVPFFLIGGCAQATGIGNVVSALPDPPQRHLILLKPTTNISTAAAYAAIDATLTTDRAKPILFGSPEAAKNGNSLQWRVDELINDFESVIFDTAPEIKRAKDALNRSGAEHALLAGSGSSVFGIFSGRESQQRALEKIDLEEGWRVFSCDTVSRSEYVDALGVCPL